MVTSFFDGEGRTWEWDAVAEVWYAPDHGLEFDTLDEIKEEYGSADESE